MTDTIDSNTNSWGDDFQQDSNKMPAFLKVLCILTFIGSGLGILGAIYNIAMFETTKASFKMLMHSNNPVFKSMTATDAQLDNYLHWTWIGAFVSLIACLLTLTGALLMWKRKKAGFFIYIIGEIGPVFTGIMLMIASSGMSFLGMGSGISAGFGILIAVAFIIMYGLNLKHLR